MKVGQTTLISGEGELVVGEGPVRTGVTVIIPREDIGTHPLYAGYHSLNGNGEMTGTHWIQEAGLLTTPIAHHQHAQCRHRARGDDSALGARRRELAIALVVAGRLRNL